MGRKINYQFIKKKRTYTVTELSKTLRCHKRTIQRWIAHEGFPVINPNSKLYYISGEDARNYVKEKYQSKKIKLLKNEFYCIWCRGARPTIEDQLQFKFTGKLIGKGQRQIDIIGKCPVCFHSLHRWTSEIDILNLFSPTTLRERGLILIDKGGNSHNNDTKEVLIAN